MFPFMWPSYFSIGYRAPGLTRRSRKKRPSPLKRLFDQRNEDKQRLENALNELPDIVSRSLFVSKLNSYERKLLGI